VPTAVTTAASRANRSGSVQKSKRVGGKKRGTKASKQKRTREKKKIRILAVAAAAMPTRKHSPLMLMQSLLRAC